MIADVGRDDSCAGKMAGTQNQTQCDGQVARFNSPQGQRQAGRGGQGRRSNVLQRDALCRHSINHSGWQQARGYPNPRRWVDYHGLEVVCTLLGSRFIRPRSGKHFGCGCWRRRPIKAREAKLSRPSVPLPDRAPQVWPRFRLLRHFLRPAALAPRTQIARGPRRGGSLAPLVLPSCAWSVHGGRSAVKGMAPSVSPTC